MRSSLSIVVTPELRAATRRAMATAKPEPIEPVPAPAPLFTSWANYLLLTTPGERRAWCAKKAKGANRPRPMSGDALGAVSAAEVLEIMERSHGRCHHCGSLAVERRPSDPINGAPMPWAAVGRRIGSLEHLVNVVEGGTNDAANLAWCCLWCNTWDTERRTPARSSGTRSPTTSFSTSSSTGAACLFPPRHGMPSTRTPGGKTSGASPGRHGTGGCTGMPSSYIQRPATPILCGRRPRCWRRPGGSRRPSVAGLDLAQLDPSYPDELRRVKKAKLSNVRGKGRTSRTVFLGRDARHAVADYLETERPGDADQHSEALFLAASSIGPRRPGGRLSPRSINTIVAGIGRFHDAEVTDRERQLGMLRPHDLRHTIGYRLSEASGHNRAELERRLGHANDRYLRLYTNPPDDIAASYVEDL